MNEAANSSPAIIFVTLLIKVGVMALLAGFIARFGLFRELRMIEKRTPRQKLQFAAFLGIPFMLGVMARLAGYRGADLSLEVTVLAGLLGGTIVGLAVGMMVSLPAWLIGHEFVAFLMAVLYACVAALTSQINPHFLFNTLNTVSSLVRFDPDMARTVILKLSNILRRRLKAQVHFSPLKQELEFVDDYLDIEVVRFGREKLQIRKEIEPEALDTVVPSMILQPLVENAIRHGIAPKIEGGTITLRAHRRNGRLRVEVADDGVGIPPEKQTGIYESGIGISNVRERLKVLYGQEFSFDINSQPGKGTAIRLELPELVVPQATAESAHATT